MSGTKAVLINKFEAIYTQVGEWEAQKRAWANDIEAALHQQKQLEKKIETVDAETKNTRAKIEHAKAELASKRLEKQKLEVQAAQRQLEASSIKAEKTVFVEHQERQTAKVRQALAELEASCQKRQEAWESVMAALRSKDMPEFNEVVELRKQKASLEAEHKHLLEKIKILEQGDQVRVKGLKEQVAEIRAETQSIQARAATLLSYRDRLSAELAALIEANAARDALPTPAELAEARNTASEHYADCEVAYELMKKFESGELNGDMCMRCILERDGGGTDDANDAGTAGTVTATTGAESVPPPDPSPLL